MYKKITSRANRKNASEIINEEECSSNAGNRENISRQLSTCNPQSKIIVNVASTQYEVVVNVMKNIFHFEVTTNNSMDFDLFWADTGITVEMVSKLKSYQKINHFPGMSCLARKNLLGRNLMRMKSIFPEEYKFFPPTWVLPLDLQDFKLQFKGKKNKTFILKPEALSQGRGIFLTRKYEGINPYGHYVAQRYIHKPLLIDGLKFDLRIYVLVYGCDPLRIFIYKDGLARLATEKYQPPKMLNLSNLFMHLTNYAINKNSDKFIYNNDENNADFGHKRSLSFVWKYIDEIGGNSNEIFDKIKKLVVKTICAVQPILAHTYKSCQSRDDDNNKCFEILGFDILIDQKFDPWLIEVNHSPSFTTDTPFDLKIKTNLITDVIKLIGLNLQNKNKYFTPKLYKSIVRNKKKGKDKSEEKKMKQNVANEIFEMGLFEMVYPDKEIDYDIFIKSATYEEYASWFKHNNNDKSESNNRDEKPSKNKLSSNLVKHFPIFKNVSHIKPDCCENLIQSKILKRFPKQDKFKIIESVNILEQIELPENPNNVEKSRSTIGKKNSKEDMFTPYFYRDLQKIKFCADYIVGNRKCNDPMMIDSFSEVFSKQLQSNYGYNNDEKTLSINPIQNNSINSIYELINKESHLKEQNNHSSLYNRSLTLNNNNSHNSCFKPPTKHSM